MVVRVSRWKKRELWEGEDKSPAARERGREGAVCREVGERGTGLLLLRLRGGNCRCNQVEGYRGVCGEEREREKEGETKGDREGGVEVVQVVVEVSSGWESTVGVVGESPETRDADRMNRGEGRGLTRSNSQLPTDTGGKNHDDKESDSV